jgi:hypothetical protein
MEKEKKGSLSRRDFLKGTAAGAVGVAAMGVLRSGNRRPDNRGFGPGGGPQSSPRKRQFQTHKPGRIQQRRLQQGDATKRHPPVQPGTDPQGDSHEL